MAAGFGKRTRPSTLVGGWLGNGLVLERGSFESIATTTVGSGGAANVTFSSIPQTYKHLQIRALVKSEGSQDSTDMRFNSDTGNNYAYHSLYGTGSAASSEASTSRSSVVTNFTAVASTDTSVFSVGVMDILDYTDTNKYKTVRGLSGWDANGTGVVYLSSNVWMSTSAITTILIYPRAGGDFNQYSHFALYGIKG